MIPFNKTLPHWQRDALYISSDIREKITNYIFAKKYEVFLKANIFWSIIISELFK
jgi:hypothetical protein